jgi:hypothetical protein
MTGNRQNIIPPPDPDKDLTPYRIFTLNFAAVTFLVVEETNQWTITF